MSVDVTISADGCCTGHSHQFTYNYTPLLREAGFPSWNMLDGLPVSSVVPMVNKLMLEISNPHRRDAYTALIRGGGEWGTLNTLLDSLSALRTDMGKHPDGVVLTR